MVRRLCDGQGEAKPNAPQTPTFFTGEKCSGKNRLSGNRKTNARLALENMGIYTSLHIDFAEAYSMPVVNLGTNVLLMGLFSRNFFKFINRRVDKKLEYSSEAQTCLRMELF